MRLLSVTCRSALVAAVVSYGIAQTQVDLRTQSKSVDFSAATFTKPMQTGTSLPGSCSTGAMFLKTDAPAGQNVYACTSANTWSLEGGAGGRGAYSSSFTSQTTVTIPGTAHQLNTANVVVTCYDTESPAMEVEPNNVAVNASTFDVSVTFANPQSGRCVVSSGGGEGGGGGIGLGFSNTYAAGAKQTMVPSASTAGLSLTPGTLPTNPVAGDLAVDANAGNVLKTFNGSTWSVAGGGGGYATSFTSQTSVTIAGAAHQLNTANVAVNCYDTETPAMEVDPNTVSVNLTTYDVTINFAQAQSGRCVVSSGGAGSGGAIMAAQLRDFAVVSNNSTTLTIGGNCSTAAPCNVRVGGQIYSFTSGATVTLAGGSGTAYFYVDVNGLLTVGHNLAVSCTGCTAVSGITAFPPNAVPLFTWAAANNVWSASGPMDYRAFLGGQYVTAGTGILVSASGPALQVGVNTAVVPTYLKAGATLSFPSINAGTCAADQTISFPGAAPGDAVAPGWPASLPSGLLGTMWISATGTLSVRLCNLSAATVTAASNTFTAADVRSF